MWEHSVISKRFYLIFILALYCAANLTAYNLSVGNNPSGACFLHLNQDSYIDIILGHHNKVNENSPSISILLNDGTGHFAVADESNRNMGFEDYMVMHDINNDGTLDLIAQYEDNYGGAHDNIWYVRVFNNFSLTNHSYVDYSIASEESYEKIICIDLPNNEHAICRASNNHFLWSYIRFRADGTPYPLVSHNMYYPQWDIESADLNHDGIEEVILIDISGLDSYWTWMGDHFTETNFNAHYGIDKVPYIGDVNGDNIIEIVINYPDPEPVFLKLCSLPNLQGLATIHVPYPYPGKLLVSDFDNDGINDFLYLMDLPNPSVDSLTYMALKFNYFPNYFTEPDTISIGEYSNIAYAIDVNNDSYNDVVELIGGSPGRLYITYNDTNGGFLEDNSTHSNDFPVYETDTQISSYPNPFTSTTRVEYTLSKIMNVDIMVYNTKGQKIKRIMSGQQSSGKHVFVWDGSDVNGNPVASGLYFVKLSTPNQIKTTKLLLIK